MFWSIFVWPIVFSAGVLQRILGTAEERETREWEDRLHYGDFFFGFLAILAGGAVLAFAVIAWAGVGRLELRYLSRANAALQNRDYPQAVVACQRLVEMHPADKKFRYLLATAHSGAGDHERAAGLMQTLAPADGSGVPQAELWVAERKLAQLTAKDVDSLRDVESRLIRLREDPHVGPQATVLLVRLYFLTGRAAFVLSEPALRAAAQGVPELHLSLLQTSIGRISPPELKREADELQAHFQAKVKSNPSDLPSRRAAIGTEILLGNFPAASQLLRDGLTLHPGDEDLQRLWGAAAVAQAQAAQFSAASPALRKRLAQDAVQALERSPQPGDAFTLRLAQMQHLAGNDVESERQYRLVLDKFPIARLELGEILSAADRKDDAAVEFEKLLAHCLALPEAERNAPPNQLLTGAAQLRLKKWPDAEKTLTPLLGKVPEAKPLLLQMHLETADAAENDPAKRLDALKAALKLEPFFQPALQRLLQPLGDDASNAAARKMIVDLAAGGDAPAAAYLLLGTDAVLRKDLETAEKYLDLAFRSAPQSPVILNNLAWSLAFGPKADLNRALALVQAADQKLPNNPQIQDTHGRILAKLGRWKDALTQFQACAKTYDDRSEFHLAIAEVYESLKLPELSRRHKERAEEITLKEKKSQAPPDGDNKADDEKNPAATASPRAATSGTTKAKE